MLNTDWVRTRAFLEAAIASLPGKAADYYGSAGHYLEVNELGLAYESIDEIARGQTTGPAFEPCMLEAARLMKLERPARAKLLTSPTIVALEARLRDAQAKAIKAAEELSGVARETLAREPDFTPDGLASFVTSCVRGMSERDFETFKDGLNYCQHCGGAPGCQCWNDE